MRRPVFTAAQVEALRFKPVEPVPAPPPPSVKRELKAPSCRGGGIPGAARRLAAGEITRDEYVRQTARDYDSLAKRLSGFWSLPRAVEHEDIVQELYLATFDWVRRWDPTRAPIGRFLVFNSMADTKKWLNRQRRARNGSEPSQHEELIDDLFHREDGTGVEPGELTPVFGGSHEKHLFQELLAGVDFGQDGADQCLLALLFEDSDDDATQTLIEEGIASSSEEAHRRIDQVRARAQAIWTQ